jgi:acetyl esterase/lipase
LTLGVNQLKKDPSLRPMFGTSMQSIKSRFFYFVIKRKLAQMRAQNLPLAESRAMQEKTVPNMFKMPLGVSMERVEIRGLQALWLRPDAQRSRGIVLYLHGGAYVQGSINTSRALAARLALASQTSTLSLDYRLAPEHPYPAAVDDAFDVYCELLKNHPGRPIAITGDSAGGGLSLALTLRIRDAGLPLPAALALLSPWTDLTLSNETHTTLAKLDPFFENKELLQDAALAYGMGHSLKLPCISPQFASFNNFPPALIHVGTLEALLDDSRLLAQKMSEDGTLVELKVYAGMWHVWQVFGGLFKEADQSIAELGLFMKTHLERAHVTSLTATQRVPSK